MAGMSKTLPMKVRKPLSPLMEAVLLREAVFLRRETLLLLADALRTGLRRAVLLRREVFLRRAGDFLLRVVFLRREVFLRRAGDFLLRVVFLRREVFLRRAETFFDGSWTCSSSCSSALETFFTSCLSSSVVFLRRAGAHGVTVVCDEPTSFCVLLWFFFALFSSFRAGTSLASAGFLATRSLTF